MPPSCCCGHAVASVSCCVAPSRCSAVHHAMLLHQSSCYRMRQCAAPHTASWPQLSSRDLVLPHLADSCAGRCTCGALLLSSVPFAACVVFGHFSPGTAEVGWVPRPLAYPDAGLKGVDTTNSKRQVLLGKESPEQEGISLTKERH